MAVGQLKSAPRGAGEGDARLDLQARLAHNAQNRWGDVMHEYKVVPVPTRAPKVKGLKTTAERFAHGLAEAINAEAAGGWQFQRTESLPCEERGTLGKVRQTIQVVMIFARPLGLARPDAGAALAAAQDHYAPEAPRAAPVWEPAHQPAAPQPAALHPGARREPLFRSGALLRGDTAPRTEPSLRPRPPTTDDA